MCTFLRFPSFLHCAYLPYVRKKNEAFKNTNIKSTGRKRNESGRQTKSREKMRELGETEEVKERFK